jgi:CubicO group peptidase (beta-lactamase class C family)
MTGVRVPEFAALDDIMQNYMQANGISAGMAAVMRNGVPVYHRAFGWDDQAKTVPLQPDAVMRLASVTKPLTAAAVRKLIAAGEFGLHDRVFSVGGSSGLLDLAAFGTPDARLDDITVDHLLRHRGGWDRDLVGDLTYRERQIAQAMSVSSPPGRDATARYIMGQPLQFAPGSREAYSNIGYLLLGLIVEKYSGKPHIEYLQDDVFAPLGVPAGQMLAGRTFAEDHDPREPYYDSSGDVDPNVFWPAKGAGPNVPAAYGGWDHEARVGQGGIVANPLALLEFLDEHQVNGPGIGGPRPAPGSWRWNHTGSLQGTNALARQRGDGVNFVVLFNKNPSSGSYAADMRTQIDTLFDSGAVTWPTLDVTRIQVGHNGDFNLDGVTDAEDLLHWRLAYGRTALADANDDSRSDGADFLAWQRGVGVATSAAAAPIPEPSGAALFIGTAATMARSARYSATSEGNR